jgi:hypothetical protein
MVEVNLDNEAGKDFVIVECFTTVTQLGEGVRKLHSCDTNLSHRTANTGACMRQRKARIVHLREAGIMHLSQPLFIKSVPSHIPLGARVSS